eukprot:7378744-Prymnesium_polylepis.1
MDLVQHEAVPRRERRRALGDERVRGDDDVKAGEGGGRLVLLHGGRVEHQAAVAWWQSLLHLVAPVFEERHGAHDERAAWLAGRGLVGEREHEHLDALAHACHWGVGPEAQ